MWKLGLSFHAGSLSRLIKTEDCIIPICLILLLLIHSSMNPTREALRQCCTYYAWRHQESKRKLLILSHLTCE